MKTKDKCEPAVEQICFKIWAKVLYDKMNGPQKTFISNQSKSNL